MPIRAFAPLLLTALLCGAPSVQAQEASRNFWDLGEPAHTEEHAQSLAPEAEPKAPPASEPAAPAPAEAPATVQDGAAEAAPAPPTQAPPAGAKAAAEGTQPTAPGESAPIESGPAVSGAAPDTGDAEGAESEVEQPGGIRADALEAGSVDTLYRLGQAAQRRGNDREAERYYQAVLSRAPYHVLTHLALGRLYLSTVPARALKHLETAVQVHPSSQDAHYLMGQAYEALGRHLDAAEAYRYTIHLNPRHYDANARLRKLLRALRSRQSVVDRAAESFYAQPNLATLTLFGRLVMERMPPQEAVLEFEEVRRRQPDLAEVELWLARAQHALGDTQGELTAYRRYLEQRPRANGVRLLVVERLAEQGWYRNAATLLAPLEDGADGARGDLSPDARARVTFLRSRLLSVNGEPARAGEVLLAAHAAGYDRAAVAGAFAEDLSLYPDSAGLWMAYGQWLRAAERPQEATEALARAGVLDAGQREQVRPLLEQMQGQNVAPVAARLALGELAWADGDGERALALLEAVPPGHALDHRAALLRGRIHRARGELDAALDDFTRYVFFFTDRQDVLYARGNLFWELGRKEEAIAVWMEHPQVLLRHPSLLANVAEYQRTAGDAAAELATRERLAQAVPGNHPNRMRLGELYWQQGRKQDAVALWERVLDDRPRDPDLLARTGKALLELGERDRALPLLQRASQLRALDESTSALLARELYRTHQYEAALDAYWSLHASNPQHPDLPRVLPELVLNLPATTEQRWVAARMAMDAGRLEPASELLQAILNDAPGDMDARLALAGTYLRWGRPQQAEAVLTDSAADTDRRPEALRLLAQAQERQRHRAALAKTLATLHALQPDDAALARRRGLLLAELQRPEEARPLLEEALAAHPEDDALALALADVATTQGDTAAAEGHLRALLIRQPGHPEAQRRLTDLMLREQRWSEATAMLEDWVAAHPDDANARYNLITAYLKVFDKEAARPHFRALQQSNPRKARPLAPYFQ